VIIWHRSASLINAVTENLLQTCVPSTNRVWHSCTSNKLKLKCTQSSYCVAPEVWSAVWFVKWIWRCYHLFYWHFFLGKDFDNFIFSIYHGSLLCWTLYYSSIVMLILLINLLLRANAEFSCIIWKSQTKVNGYV